MSRRIMIALAAVLLAACGESTGPVDRPAPPPAPTDTTTTPPPDTTTWQADTTKLSPRDTTTAPVDTTDAPTQPPAPPEDTATNAPVDTTAAPVDTVTTPPVPVDTATPPVVDPPPVPVDSVIPPTQPQPTRVPFKEFFTAWAQSYSASPIETQLFALDARQRRQVINWYPNEATLAFAREHPGQLYIVGDEPDQSCKSALEYAQIYHNAIVTVRGADPTARFSPSGFAEPNHYCCPSETVYEVCWEEKHSISYAQQFYDSYVAQYGEAPPAAEWRFHDFGNSIAPGDIDSWYARVDKAAAWSVAHGANMVLASWGFLGWSEPVEVTRHHMEKAMNLLMADTRINEAVWWSLQPWVDSTHYLENLDGSLTPYGETYSDPFVIGRTR